jgi:hypothetical protein
VVPAVGAGQNQGIDFNGVCAVKCSAQLGVQNVQQIDIRADGACNHDAQIWVGSANLIAGMGQDGGVLGRRHQIHRDHRDFLHPSGGQGGNCLVHRWGAAVQKSEGDVKIGAQAMKVVNHNVQRGSNSRIIVASCYEHDGWCRHTSPPCG